mmetsp:Transcript_28488/g.42922  ORF Transcript_28488/g.42922 Transcript_28488/m.42922 type:complete len:101 (-) Transcript_28488:210-512(-)
MCWAQFKMMKSSHKEQREEVFLANRRKLNCRPQEHSNKLGIDISVGRAHGLMLGLLALALAQRKILPMVRAHVHPRAPPAQAPRRATSDTGWPRSCCPMR